MWLVGRDVISGAREHAPRFTIENKLHPDPVPFPFRLVVGGVKTLEVAGLVHRVRQHHRMEGLALADLGRRRPAVEPGEEIPISSDDFLKRALLLLFASFRFL